MSNNEWEALNIDVTLKGTSLGVINIPTKILKELKWNVNEIVQVCISDCVNHENEEWQEIQVMRKIDVNRVYKEKK
jgi:hypothetical protein|tara:strand:+ start:341 stop:568 length:228 start_codon:yes stop_codon:yes gene_type:complete